MPAGARVLEIGCGAGALARELIARGYDVLAVDPQAPTGAPFVQTRFESLTIMQPFDAIVAAISLHHVHDLDAAVAKMANALVPGGHLIVEEFGWERVDAATAAWYYAHWRKLDAAGGGRKPFPPGCAGTHAEYVSERADLHRSHELLAAFDRYFARDTFAWMPYLARELGDPEGEAEEVAAIAGGAMQAVGFRYVGHRAEVTRG